MRMIKMSLFSVYCMSAMFLQTPCFADFTLWNRDPATFRINDDSSGVYTYVNNYFNLYDENAYTSSNQLYADRGVREIPVWTSGENSWCIEMFKDADLSHTLSFASPDGRFLLDSEGHRLFQANYPPGPFPLESNMQKLPMAKNLMWRLDRGNEIPLFSNSALNPENVIYMALFDVTDLMRSKYIDSGIIINSAYLMSWEDMTYYDFDYNDLGIIAVNATSASVPEPASMTLWGLGFFGIAGVKVFRKYRRQKNKSLKPEL